MKRWRKNGIASWRSPGGDGERDDLRRSRGRSGSAGSLTSASCRRLAATGGLHRDLAVPPRAGTPALEARRSGPAAEAICYLVEEERAPVAVSMSASSAVGAREGPRRGKSSLSAGLGSVAQFTATKGVARAEVWMGARISSLAGPLSPEDEDGGLVPGEPLDGVEQLEHRPLSVR